MIETSLDGMRWEKSELLAEQLPSSWFLA